MKYREEDGRVVMRSTKQTNRRSAMAMATEMEHMARKARSRELTTAVILKNLGDMVERTTGESIKVVTIKEYFTGYLSSLERSGSAKSTISRYRPVLNGFINSLPSARRMGSIGSVTSAEIKEFRDQEHASGKSPSTCDFAVKVISGVLNAAKREGHALTNPATAVKLLKGIQETRMPFNDEQVRRLLKVTDPEWTGMVLMGYHAGLRLNDAANLLWENIDLDEGTVTFMEMKTSRRKRTANPETTIVLHHDILEWTKTYPVGVGKAPVFPCLAGRTSGSAAGLSNQFRDLMKKARIDVQKGRQAKGKGRTFNRLGYHSLRHSMISNLANAGVSADVRKSISGHSSDEIHRRYVHLNLSTQKAAVDKLPSVL